MKKTLVLTALVLALTACGGDDHSKVYAVDVVETAEQNAKDVAPVAEPIKFDDENAPKAGEASAATETTSGAPAETAENSTETSEETKADDAKADEKTAEVKAETEDKKAEEKTETKAEDKVEADDKADKKSE